MKRRQFLAAMLAIPVAPAAVREIRTIREAKLVSVCPAAVEAGQPAIAIQIINWSQSEFSITVTLVSQEA